MVLLLIFFKSVGNSWGHLLLSHYMVATGKKNYR